jgi:hypothetical protein
MNPAQKRFEARYTPIADAIASLDLDQEDREAVAKAVADALSASGQKINPAFRHDLFVLLASDPLVPCAGFGGQPCPHGRVIRVAMHLSSAPDGRSVQWRQRAPYGQVRCVSCGVRWLHEGEAA